MADDRDVKFLFARKHRYTTNIYKPPKEKHNKASTHKKSQQSHRAIEKNSKTNVNNESELTKANFISLLVNKKQDKSKNYKLFHFKGNGNMVLVRSDRLGDQLAEQSQFGSEPDVNNRIKKSISNTLQHTQSSEFVQKDKQYYNRNYIVNNCCRTCNKPECNNPFNNPLLAARILRCQIGGKEETCCCNCNSDAMFEVMKSLYDCYKKKDCTNCNCILCGHAPAAAMLKAAQEQKSVGVGEERKSVSVGVGEDRAREKAVRISPLADKTAEQKEKILKDLAKTGAPLPEPATASEKKLISQIRTEMGLPPEPKTAEERAKLEKAAAAGIITPLEGKTQAQKEKALQKMAEAGVPLPEGRTPSEKVLIAKLKTQMPMAIKIPSKKLNKAKAAGLLTPLAGKTNEQKEKILKGLAEMGMPLPEPQTASEGKLINKVQKDMGLPPAPKTSAERTKINNAIAAGIITPLEEKTPAQKEQALKKMAAAGIPLPEGRTASEKALIDKVAATAVKVPSEKLRKAEAAGLLTPLQGKSAAQKDKIIRGLAQAGLPLPEPKTASEAKLVNKIRKEVGLPPEPKTPEEKKKMEKAMAAGIISPLEGKTPAQKEQALRKMAEAGIAMPEGRTASEKALVKKVMATTKPVPTIPSEKLRKAQAQGLLTPLTGKPDDEKARIIKGLTQAGLPIPEPKTASEAKLVNKIRQELGLPPEPKTAEERAKLEKGIAAGIVTPLEGKTPAQKEQTLKKMAAAGIPLPEGRTASEKALIDKVAATAVKVPSEKLRKAEAAGLLTPLQGKSAAQKDKIIRGLAQAGLPLPEPKTASEAKLVNKIRKEVGLPPEPKTPEEKKKMEKAMAAGIITPLEGKTPAQKEQALRKMAEAGIAMPEGRTASEKALVKKVMATTKPVPTIPSEKLRKAQAQGLLTPLTGKPDDEKARIIKGLTQAGLPIPEPKTASEAKLVNKIRQELGLPPEPKTAEERAKLEKGIAAGIVTPLEGKTPAQKEQTLKKMAAAGIPLPEGRTASEKALIDKVAATAVKVPSEKLRKAEAAGLLTPLQGKSAAQKDKIIRGLAQAGLPLPEPKTASEAKLVNKIRKEVGLPPEPKTAEERAKLEKGIAAGIVTPLEGKTPAQKEQALKKMAAAGIPLPEGRTASEKALIGKIALSAAKIAPVISGKVPSEKLRKAQADGLMTPLEGKTRDQKEKILRGLAMMGLPLAEGKTASDRKLADKVRKDLGVSPAPKTDLEKKQLAKAYAQGIVSPLEGKTHADKEKILRKLAKAGVKLPDGRTPSEIALINQIMAELAALPSTMTIPSEKLRKAKAEGLLTPLAGKSPEQKDKILRSLAKAGLPLEPTTASDKKLADKIRNEMGLPPEPKTEPEKRRMAKAYAAGIITPLEGKSNADKEKILKKMADAGLLLPEGRTPSEKALIDKVRLQVPPPIPSEKLRKLKAEGLATPLEGKSRAQKEKILRGLAMNGLPLPEGKTASDRKLADKVRRDLGVSPAPKTEAEKKRLNEAYAQGIISPLEGKTHADKEKVLRKIAKAGIPMPVGRSPSEKALIQKIMSEKGALVSAISIPSEKLRRAKAEGLLTPLDGKSNAEKEKILKGLAKIGMPLPEAKTESEKKLANKIRDEMGLPSEPKTELDKKRIAKAYAEGIITPLEGKSNADKEKVLRKMAEAGVPLPIGRTASEKALIEKIKGGVPPKISAIVGVPSEKLRKAKAEGFITPLEGKNRAQKEKILRGLAMMGLPLPEGKTDSDRKLANKVRKDLGVSPTPKTEAEKKRLAKAYAQGIVSPLEGKTHADKEKVLRNLAKAGVHLPIGRTPSEKALIDKIMAEMGALVSAISIPSEKLRKAKAAGLLTPLEGKTNEQKEKIMKDLAKLGMPLPEATTASEKKLANKLRQEMGLPVEPKTELEKKRLKKAYAEGIITPLEGKSKAEKEKVLRKMAEAGVPLPEGRTASEKEMIAKLKSAAPPRISAIGVPPDKLRKAQAEGLMTPLEGKTRAQKEKILRGLAMMGLPLPEGKTASDRNLVDKVRKDLGVPAPKNESEKKQLAKAYAQGIVSPLEGKTHADKEKLLRKLAKAGVPLPVGRTPSEIALINQIMAGLAALPSAVSIPSEKLRKAKAEGLLTPLAGKSPEQKDKILRGLVKAGMPWPEAKTASDRKIADKIRKELGLPPEPKTVSEKKRTAKAAAAGLITPLEGKSHADKEKLLRKMANAGVPLPEGRTASEKKLIKKIKDEVGEIPSAISIPSEKMKKARAAGLLTPLSGKPPEKKEQILKALAAQGIPLPEGKSDSEKKVINKVRKELGLPPPPKTAAEKQNYKKAIKNGLITPLEGKSQDEKQKVLQGLAELGLPLPEGRTPSEVALINNIKGKAKPVKTPSRKLSEAKKAGLLTPLEGKSPEEKQKIIKGLAAAGLPLPEGKTVSEKKLIQKIAKDLGLPPPPRTPQEKEKWEKAAAKGIITPLEGKTDAEKERILTNLAEAGLPLPEAKTASEKKLIAKVKKTTGAVTPVPSEKIRKAKAAGLLTPLQGKTSKQKEKIVRGLAEAGLPLPEGKTASEKALVRKVKTEFGLPPEAATPSERAVVKKAAEEGLFTPLAGKTPAQKKTIVKGLLDAGLPVPEGKTASEKELIKTLRKEAGLPLELTPSEKKGQIRKMKSRKVGPAKVKGGISEKFEEIKKTTKCDQACGCDKKKIRFKHSYVKIQITSPDISSFCDCPNECLPGVKGGVFVDNEGIKVTIGRATGAPSYTTSTTSAKFWRTESCLDHGDVANTCPSDEDWDNVNDEILDKIYTFYKSLYNKRASEYNSGLDTSAIHRDNISYSKESRAYSHSITYLRSKSKMYILSSKSNISVPKNTRFASYLLCTESKAASSVIILESVSTTSICTSSISTTVSGNEISDIEGKERSQYAIEVIESGDSDYNDTETSLSIVEIVYSSDSTSQFDKNNRTEENFRKNNYGLNGQVIVLRFSEQRQKMRNEPVNVVKKEFGKNGPDVMELVTEMLSQRPLATGSSVYVLVPSEESSAITVDASPQEKKPKKKRNKNKKCYTTEGSNLSRVHLVSNAKNNCVLGINVIPGAKNKTRHILGEESFVRRKRTSKNGRIGLEKGYSAVAKHSATKMAVKKEDATTGCWDTNHNVQVQINRSSTIACVPGSTINSIELTRKKNICSPDHEPLPGHFKLNMDDQFRDQGKKSDNTCGCRNKTSNTCSCQVKTDATQQPKMPRTGSGFSLHNKPQKRDTGCGQDNQSENKHQNKSINTYCTPPREANQPGKHGQKPRCDEACGQKVPISLSIEAEIVEEEVIDECDCDNKRSMERRLLKALGGSMARGALGRDSRNRRVTEIKARLKKKGTDDYEIGQSNRTQKTMKDCGTQVQFTLPTNSSQSNCQLQKSQAVQGKCGENSQKTKKRPEKMNHTPKEDFDQTVIKLQENVGNICQQTRRLLEALNDGNKNHTNQRMVMTASNNLIPEHIMQKNTFCDNDMQKTPCYGFKQPEQEFSDYFYTQDEDDDSGDYIITTDDVDWANRIVMRSGLAQETSAGFNVRVKKKADRVDSKDLSYENLALLYNLYGPGLDQRCAGYCEDDKCPGLGREGELPPIPTYDNPYYNKSLELHPSIADTCGACETRREFELSLQECVCTKENCRNEEGVCECLLPEKEKKKRAKQRAKKRKKQANCECPVSPENNVSFESESKVAQQSTVEGLKLKVPGKGSASPGLQGICCFDFFEDFSARSSSESSGSTYLIYSC